MSKSSSVVVLNEASFLHVIDPVFIINSLFHLALISVMRKLEFKERDIIYYKEQINPPLSWCFNIA